MSVAELLALLQAVAGKSAVVLTAGCIPPRHLTRVTVGRRDDGATYVELS